MSHSTIIPTDRTHKQFWTEFFQLLKENPSVWDPTNPAYHKKTLRTLALNLLLEKYWEIDSSATIETVKKRIQHFRSGFLREHKRVADAALNGSSYTSRLWYYNYITFLKDYGQDEETLQEWDRNECSDNVIELTHGTVVFNDGDSHTEPDTVITSTSSPEEATFSNLPTITGVTSIAEEQQTTLPRSYVLPISSVIDQVKDKSLDQPEEEDDCSTFAAHLRMRMRKFIPSQKVIAQKLISDIMFMADTHQLDVYSVIVNPIAHMVPIGPVAIPQMTNLTTMAPAASVASAASAAPVTPVTTNTASMTPLLPKSAKVGIPRSATKNTKPAGGSFSPYAICSDDDDKPMAKKKK